MTIINNIFEALQAGKTKMIKQLVPQALEEGINAQAILEEGLLAAMDIVGARFKANEIFVPEVLIAARAMNAGTEILKPYLAAAGTESRGKVVLGTVKGDLHDIGKNLVRMMFEGKGLEVIDLGVDVDADSFIKAAIDNDCKIIACSALLTTTMPEIGKVVEASVAAGIRGRVKIMVGGAPLNQAFCDSIGADVYTSDAASAANKAVELLSA